MFTAAKAMWAGITSVLGMGSTLVQGWQERKKAKLESDIALDKAKTEATIKRVQTRDEADIAWENLSLEQSGWKDEYWTLVLSIPMIMCFIPSMNTYVDAGFKALETTPEWYRYFIGIAIGSAFGVKITLDTIKQFMQMKKGA